MNFWKSAPQIFINGQPWSKKGRPVISPKYGLHIIAKDKFNKINHLPDTTEPLKQQNSRQKAAPTPHIPAPHYLQGPFVGIFQRK